MSFLFPFRGKKIKNTAKARRANLRLEMLEDRAVPAVYTVAGFADGLGFVAPTGPDTFNASTFRAAILAANASVGVDDIIILPSGVYDLTLQGSGDEGDLDITDNVEIRGAGLNSTFVDATTLDNRIFDISGSATVTISGLTMGNANAPVDEGGGIRNAGDLTILNSVITNNVLNAADDALGGGIYNSGTLTITNSSITNNVANGDDSFGDGDDALGGGIYNAANATATITNSTISGNQANGGTGGDDGGDGSGGGIRNNINATLIITNSTIADNTARGGNGGGGSSDDGGDAFGGGIRNTSGTVTITGSTISGNQAIGGNVSTSADDGGGAVGGGIRSDGTGALLALINSTISGNSADGGNGGTGSGDLGGNGVGGGVSIAGGTATIRNSTITLNDATGGSGTIAGTGDGGGVADSNVDTTSVLSSIIAGNTSENTNPDVSGTFNSEGFNLIGIADPNGFDDVSDQVGTSGDPLLALLDALADNGGPTLTHLPQPNSPALNMGNNALDLTTDQRGFKPRDAGAGTDVGAVERDANSPAVIAVGSGKKNPGVVNVFDGNGNPIFTNLQPYGKKFKGGIRVAVGDVTGDETPDIVVAPNSGKLPIKVFDGATGQEVVGLEILPYGKKYKAGMSIAVGNVIADNVSPGNEIIVGALKKNLPVKVFSVDGVEQSSFIAFNQSNTSGAEVAAGNVDGLGLDEVFVLATSNRNRVFILDGLGNTVLAHFIAEALLGSGSIAVGDFNSDGMAEIALGNGAVKKSGGNQVHIYTTSGVLLNSFDAFADPFTGGVRVATADIDNNGVDELLAGPGAGADLDVLIFDALAATELDSFLGSEATKKRGIFLA